MKDPKTYILSVETSTPTCSVALHGDDQLLAMQEVHVEKSHSAVLALMIRDIMNYCGLDINEINALAVAEGPGSYTGLRIGASTVKGLCYGNDKPLIAVGTLEAMAHGMLKKDTIDAWFCPMIDARRMEVYCIVMDPKGEIIQPPAAKVIDAYSFQELLSSHPMVFFGPGADKCTGVLDLHANAHLIKGCTPSAADVGILAYRKWQAGSFNDAAYFEPFYLKEYKAGKPKQLK